MSKACVLSGGGAKGAFQVGVFQRLAEKGIAFDHYYGTSVGALNSAGMSYLGISKLTEVWLSIKSRSDILKSNFFLTLPWSSGLYSMEPLKKKINSLIQGEPTASATVTLVSLMSGELKYVNNKAVSIEEFRQSVHASSSIPFVMEPVGDWVDGGVREQAPLKQAILDGHDDITIIMCNPVTQNPVDKWTPSFPRLISNGLRAIDIMEHEVMLDDIAECTEKNSKPGFKKISLKVYAPEFQLMDTVDFEPGKIRNAIKEGREAVL